MTRSPRGWVWLGPLALLLFWTGCVRARTEPATWLPPTAVGARPARSTPQASPFPRATLNLPPTRGPGTPIWTPTPDPPRVLPTPRSAVQRYVVQPGDTLALIAARFQVSVDMLMEANRIQDPNWIAVGQTLVIPPPIPAGTAPETKLLPDAELVYGPYAALFDLHGFVQTQDGYLAGYSEVVDGQHMSGADIVQRVALEYSVGPRTLLALLEYRSGWVTQKTPASGTQMYPLGMMDPRYKGLWKQLSWAARELNKGYYLWKANAVGGWLLADGSWVRANPRVNAGTAAVHRFLGLLYGYPDWEQAVGPEGFLKTYQDLFGWPFDYAIEPLVPEDLTPPTLLLPFPKGATWYFTGGPHAAWGAGTPWGAVDFAPGDGPPGCYLSTSWATAAADGLVVRSRHGVVALDLDMDGYEQTGWVLIYLHLAAQDRVPEGAWVRAGERLGHPSCEGGVATGTHVHFTWKYNGQWLAAFGRRPMVLSGWRVESTGRVYDGWLVKGGKRIEACACRSPANAVPHTSEEASNP